MQVTTEVTIPDEMVNDTGSVMHAIKQAAKSLAIPGHKLADYAMASIVYKGVDLLHGRYTIQVSVERYKAPRIAQLKKKPKHA